MFNRLIRRFRQQAVWKEAHSLKSGVKLALVIDAAVRRRVQSPSPIGIAVRNLANPTPFMRARVRQLFNRRVLKLWGLD